MPPVDQAKADPLTLLLDEIELLSAQTRTLELSLKRAHTDAFEEVEKFQQQFRDKLRSLKAEFKDWGNSDPGNPFEDGIPPHIQNQDLLRRFAEQQNLLQRAHEESERRGAAIVALREQLSRLEAANRELEQNAALRVEEVQPELKPQITQLQAEIARKDEILQRLQAERSQMEQSGEANVRRLEMELKSTRESADRQGTELERADSERKELRQRLTELESTGEQGKTAAAREIEVLRRDAQAKIAALQSEIAHKTVLLTQNQSTIARLEEDLKAISQPRSRESETESLLETRAAEIARRDTEIAELRAAAERQAKAAAEELAHARETFSAQVEALRCELNEKQLLLEQRQSLQNAEQELRNRYRELQGRLAAKESVIESQEYHLRSAQTQLLATRDALGQKERALEELQARATEQDQHVHDERNQWQCRLAETQLLNERYKREIDREKAELAGALERHSYLAQEQSAIREQAQQLGAQVDDLTSQLKEKQATLDSEREAARRSEARAAELGAALAETQDARARQEERARNIEQSLTAELARLRLELERHAEALRERDLVASRPEPDFTAQMDDLQTRLQEKERLLEARAREIAVLQARVESLSGQTTRLEAAQKQALADASNETNRTRQALQAEIAALQSASEKQQTVLEERKAELNLHEETLRAEIKALKEQSAGQQTLLEKQSGDMRQATEEANTLREHMAQIQFAARDADEIATRRSASDARRIAALEHEIESTKQMLAQSEAALHHIEQQSREAAHGADGVHHQAAGENQSAQLRAAQGQIAELLDRLAQLEAARHSLQENAGHELQQLRESFETRIANLRMELAAKEQARPQEPAPADNQIVITRLEEGFQKQIQELHMQLAEQHALLENRNEELIRVKAELDELRDRFTHLGDSAVQGAIEKSHSVELREEDAVDPLNQFNGSAPPDTLRPLGAEALREDSGAASNRFTQLEGRVRTWNPRLEKDSAFASSRRWHIGLFKRRWKA